MDIVLAIKTYVSKFFNEVSGMKVLLLDSETSQLLSNQVYLIDRIDNEKREKLVHLKCICFIRPDSVQSLVEELRDPKYGEYHLYFSNIVKKSVIERLAESDEQEVVKQVQEFYADYIALNNDLFLIDISKPKYKLVAENGGWDTNALLRCTDGLMAVLLSLKKKPSIRYPANSTLCKKLAQELHYQIQSEHQLFDFRKPDTAPLVILIDRKNDPVSPLLTQWTYQAMVHDLLAIHNNIADLSQIPNTRPELHKIVLSPENDTFFGKNMYSGFGDLGERVKEIVIEYQKKHDGNKKVESVEDMKRFLEDYPEFRKQSFNVTKHVTLISALSLLVTQNSLLEVSELEQSLACTSNQQTDLKTLLELLSKSIPEDIKLRLVMLYVLRYEKTANQTIPLIMDTLTSHSFPPHKTSSIKTLLAQCGQEQRLCDIYGEDVLTRTKQLFKPMKGVENVYTQHKPHILTTLEQFVKQRVKVGDYLCLDEVSKEKPQDIILFFVGGVTYGECRDVEVFRGMNPGVRVLVGGTSMLNPSRFLETFCGEYAGRDGTRVAGAFGDAIKTVRI